MITEPKGKTNAVRSAIPAPSSAPDLNACSVRRPPRRWWHALTEIVHPATLAQVSDFHPFGLARPAVDFAG